MTDVATKNPTVADAVPTRESDPVGNAPAEGADPDEMYDDTEYIPDFIQELLDDPPILPSESKDAFVCLFESFEQQNTQRPKTDLEYIWTFWAAVATWELMRYERMKAAIVGSERRVAVEVLHRQLSSETVNDKGFSAMRKAARESARLFFTDPEYRKAFAERLELAGYGARAIDAMALERALPSVSAVDRLIKTADKRLANCLRNLDAAYATRDPEDPMPRSLAACRADDLQAKRVEELRKERGYDKRKATGGE